MHKFYIFLLGLLLLFSFKGFSQDTTQTYISRTYTNQPLQQVITDLEAAYPIRFFYLDEWVAGVNISMKLTKEPLPAALQKILGNTGLAFMLYDPFTIVIIKDANTASLEKADSTQIQVPSDTVIVQENMAAPAASKKAQANLKFGPDKGNTKVRISGNVTEKSTGEDILNATIYIEELKTGTVTNERGFYSLIIPSGTYNVTYNFIGFQQEKKQLTLKTSRTINVELVDQAIQMNEVTVWGEAADRNISKIEMSTSKLDIKTIRKMPALLGEADIVKSLLLLPGVTTVGEGATGFNVRGGSTDQNLVLLDDAPVYNSSHLFGLFSVFNPDIVKDVTLYRGGIPAQYGGRVSSILDITLKEGNAKKWTGKGGIGLVSNRFALEGPIIANKLSLIVAGRGTYADWILKRSPNPSIKNTQAHFYDVNAKIDYTLNSRNKFSLSGYIGKDVYKLAADSVATIAVNASSTIFNWGSTNATFRWNHVFNKQLFSTVTAVHSSYQAKIINPDGPNAFRLPSEIVYQNLKIDFNYFASEKHKLDFGVGTIRYGVKPGSLLPDEGSAILPVYLRKEHGLESAVYINDEFKLNPSLTLMYGLRYSVFQNMGPGEVFTYEEGVPREVYTIVDTTLYSTGQVTHQYQGFEPRFSLRVGLNTSSSVKLSYNRMRQYIHLISNTTAAAPTDRWKLSSKYVKPQIGDQLAIGYFRNFLGNAFENSVEIYYKKITNIIDYKDGANLLLNQTVEADLLAGTGRAYGLEAQIKKTVGRLTGWASYTYSRTYILVDGEHPEEQINFGEYYPANYDKPHNLNVVLSYQKTRRWNLSANFVYSTGRPVTYPEGKYTIRGVAVAHYAKRNEYRIPDYHRLDVSATVEGNHRKNKKWGGSWTFSVYNVYSRRNAFSVFFRAQNGAIPEAYRLSIFGSVFPSITYNFKF